MVGSDSIAGIATRYVLDSLQIEFRWGRFSAPVQTYSRVHPATVQWVSGLILVVKWPRHGVDYPHPSSVKVKERVELYF
jgi:hypothetical protein